MMKIFFILIFQNFNNVFEFKEYFIIVNKKCNSNCIYVIICVLVFVCLKKIHFLKHVES